VTEPKCAVCGINEQRERGAALLQHSQRIGTRLVQWRECFACNASAERRLAYALGQAERSGV
jgi:hypothetical protein